MFVSSSRGWRSAAAAAGTATAVAIAVKVVRVVVVDVGDLAVEVTVVST
jgi:hypothetical protein